jgi:hypothetical protein
MWESNLQEPPWEQQRYSVSLLSAGLSRKQVVLRCARVRARTCVCGVGGGLKYISRKPNLRSIGIKCVHVFTFWLRPEGLSCHMHMCVHPTNN